MEEIGTGRLHTSLNNRFTFIVWFVFCLIIHWNIHFIRIITLFIVHSVFICILYFAFKSSFYEKATTKRPINIRMRIECHHKLVTDNQKRERFERYQLYDGVPIDMLAFSSVFLEWHSVAYKCPKPELPMQFIGVYYAAFKHLCSCVETA